MSSKRTNNLNMYTWARADALSVEEFNANFNKLDAEVSAKASKADIAGKADKAEVAQVTAQLAETVKEVNGVTPVDGKVTLPIPEVDTSQLATKNELETEKGRINNLVANAGDTDGNAELLDIRVGFDGVVYETAGDATRALSNYMKSENESWVIQNG